MNPDEWIGLAIGLAAIAISARFARRRFEQALPPASRAGRVFYTAFTFALVQLLIYGIYAVSRPGGPMQLASNLVPTLLAFTFGSFLLFGLVELVLGLFRPERSLQWRTIALAAFVVAGAGALAGPFWLADEQVILSLGLLLPATSAAAAALVWWAFLPPSPEQRPDLLG